MIRNPRPRVDVAGPRRAWKWLSLTALGAVGLSATGWAGNESAGWPGETFYYSTAEAPREYRGPLPNLLLAMNDSTAAMPRERDLLDRQVAPASGPDTPARPAASLPPLEPARPADVPRV